MLTLACKSPSSIDSTLRATQEHVLLFEHMLAEALRTYSPLNYTAVAESYLLEAASQHVPGHACHPGVGTGPRVAHRS